MSSDPTSPPTTGVTAESLTTTLTTTLGATHVDIRDMSGGCGQAFEATIVAAAFADKKSKLARARLVNGALKEEIKQIHAWSAKCYTPEEWEKKGKEEGEGQVAERITS